MPLRVFALIGSLSCILASQEASEPLAGRAPRASWTTNSAITSTGVVDVELGAHHMELRDRGTLDYWLTTLYLGLAEGFDLRLQWNGPLRIKAADGTSASGPSDPLAGFQWCFLSQDQIGVDLAVGYFHKFPTASTRDGIGTGRSDDSALLILTRSQGPWVFDFNLGNTWYGQPDQPGRLSVPSAGACVTRCLTRGWHAAAELYAFAATDRSPRIVSAGLSVTWEPAPSLALDAGVDVGATEAAQKMTVYLGLAYSFGRLFGK